MQEGRFRIQSKVRWPKNFHTNVSALYQRGERRRGHKVRERKSKKGGGWWPFAPRNGKKKPRRKSNWHPHRRREEANATESEKKDDPFLQRTEK